MKQLLLLCAICTSINLSFSQAPETSPDYNALIALYNATNGDSWSNNTNWLSNQPISTWYGITAENNRVIGINLQNNLLVGNLPIEIGDFTELLSINLQTNYLSGEIPSSIGNLSALTTLGLNNNSLSGTIPNEIGNLTNLFNLYLNANQITGSIPSSLVNLALNHNLQALNLGINKLSGIVPDFSATSIVLLWIQDNNFQFGDFENQHSAYVNNPSLSYLFSPQGFVSAPESQAVSIGQSTNINANISGSQNMFSWYRDNGDGTSTLVDSDTLFDLTINSALDYGSYYLIATSALIPGLNLRTYNLTIADLPSNHPDYNALVALYNSTNGNNWTNNTNWLDNTKPINTWFGISLEFNGNRVERLNLSNNNISGTIPPEINGLTELEEIIIKNHSLSGEIPETFWSLNLQNLFLDNSEDFEDHSLEFTNTTNLTIGNMPNLFWLELSDMDIPNQAYNEIKNSSINILTLDNCNLGSDIPVEFANFAQVIVPNNNFSGIIPNEFSTTTSLVTFNISNNLYDFSDLESLANNNNINNFLYSPQRTTDTEDSVTNAVGSNIMLSVNDTDIGRSSNTNSAMNNQYQWFKDNLEIIGAVNSSYTITNAQESDSGVYFCRITNTILPELVIDRAPITLTIDSSLNLNNNDENVISIFPNPVKNWLTIKTYNLNQASLMIYDISGRVVKQKTIIGSQNILNIEDLKTGMYLLNVKDKNKVLTLRFIKQ
ncbi:T9SS type A sorting domain-containing protein [uncultured Winogradskyella sp.]|uniref:T9SS type A sorting domain-containing protein n=1 Tax=uncultured Winogradskyella sp. TaxID=395353 RepID=UPI0026270E74|nr:T9SS type A sorting domain-containing protein [uncultured Winogradskyella sp.]